MLKPYGLTPEEAAVQFFEYCADPKTQDHAIKLLKRWKEEQEYNVSTGSVQKYAIFSKALDVVGQADPELPGKVLSGTFKISHENLVALSKMPPEEIR